MPSFVRVIPAIRTPVGVEVFDYKIPSGLTLQVGSVVTVPFRKQPTVAIVTEFLETSLFAARAAEVVGLYAGLQLPPETVRLLEWIAARTFSSRPSVLKSWLRNLPKKPAPSPFVVLSEQREPKDLSPSSGRKEILRVAQDDRQGSLTAHWTTSSQQHLIARAKECLQQGERVLILTPWKTRVAQFQQELPDAVLLHSDLADGEAFRSWQSFVTGASPLLIATRLGAWLSPVADRVLIDEPENDDHKQDELAPRYDARLMAAWCGTHGSTHVESFGLTPALHVSNKAPTIETEIVIHHRQPGGKTNIPLLQADTLLRIHEHEGPCIVIHPVRGVTARLVCRDCGWRAKCAQCGAEPSAEFEHAICRVCGSKVPLPLECPMCGGVDLGKSLPGIELLKRAWMKDDSLPTVEWRNTSNEELDAPIPPNALVIVTIPSLLGGVGEDIRREERRLVTFRRLADRVLGSHGTLLLQGDKEGATPEEETSIRSPWHDWLTSEGVDRFREREYQGRRLFQYPPATRFVKLLVDGSEAEALKLSQDIKTALKQATVRGPFQVLFRTKTRSVRHILHVVFPPQTSERTLLDGLSPFASRAMIDLDPIAFFR